MKTRWEYGTLFVNAGNWTFASPAQAAYVASLGENYHFALRILGNDGWEAYAVLPDLSVYLKRPID